ncbi:MAG: hypothetical protein ACLFQV_04875 [Vulcanimicrobiota bacterium]
MFNSIAQSGFMKTMGAGMMGALPGFLLGGPIGGLAGFGIGAFSASKGMQGKSGAGGGALIGGLAGLAMGGVPGAIGGALFGGVAGKLLGKLFGSKKKPPRQAPFYPPMPQMTGGGMMMGGGIMMPGMDMGGMQMGMGGMQMGMGGMQMGMGGMQMGMGGMSGGMMMMGMQTPMGGFGMAMAGGMHGGGMQMGMMGMGFQQPVRGGQLQQAGKGKPISYQTSGGYNVNIKGHTVTITDPSGKNTVKHWGDPHENVNGKRIKDWEGKDRSLVLGDGTKITMNADSPQGVIKNMSIYDGGQGIHINNSKNEITGVSFNPQQTALQEAYQPDGETSYVGYNKKGQFIYQNVYTQDRNLGVHNNNKMLAKGKNTWWGGRTATDHYNDPRLFWT